MKNSSKIFTLILTAGILAVAGCSGGSNSATTNNNSGSGTTTTAASSEYVTNQTTGAQPQPQVQGYSAASSSSSSTSTVYGPSGDTFIGLATDASGNVYTIDKSGTNGSYTVNEYAAGTVSTGTAAAETMHTFTSTAINLAPIGLKVDESGNIYVTLTGGTVLRFAASSSGAVSPSATITGVAGAMATDQSGNLYVTVPVSLTDGHQAIAVYSSGYASAAVPLRTILPATELYITSLAVDASGNVYAAGKDSSNNIQVAVFAAGSTGTTTAMRVITGASTHLIAPWQIQVDGAGNIYVGDSASGATGSMVMLYQFAATASGNTAPSNTIATSATYASTTAMAIH